MEFDVIKVGDLVRWTADKGARRWDIYCEVVVKTENDVTLLCFDTMTERVISKDGNALKDEVSIAMQREHAIEYIKQKKISLLKEYDEFQLKNLLAQGVLLKNIDVFGDYEKKLRDKWNC